MYFNKRLLYLVVLNVLNEISYGVKKYVADRFRYLLE